MKTEILIDAEEVLNTLGVKNVHRVGREVNYSCPGASHRYGDSRPSAYLRDSYPYPFICFGCGQQGTVVDFVAEYLGIDRAKAWRWLGERFGFDTSYDPEDSITETLNRIFGPKSRPEHKVLTNPVIDAEGFIPLSAVAPGNDYILSRGLTQDTITKFELQWDPRSGRVAIPIRDRVGNLIGFKARDITGEKEPKYLVLGDRYKSDGNWVRKENGYGFAPYNSSLVLFGHNTITNHNPPIKTGDVCLIVVEGELNCMRIHQAEYPATVGLPTAAMSSYQACMIREEYEKVILFLDSDAAGKKGTSTALNMLQGACNVRVVEDHEGDPMNMDDDQITNLIRTATNPLTNTLQQMETIR